MPGIPPVPGDLRKLGNSHNVQIDAGHMTPARKGYKTMSKPHFYTLSARLGADSSIGTIKRSDGKEITVPAANLGALFLDMAADDGGNEGTPKHHHRILSEWFSRGTAAQTITVVT